ncbi:MAG: ATP-binding protein [Thermodesulfobacteriota bacterium]|nr:ATP-binding protein [Thermodesulfobacteriota bacterium]
MKTKYKNIKLMLILMAISLLVLILAHILDLFLPARVIHNEPLHSTIETIGALASIMMGIVLLQRQYLEANHKYVWLIAGLFVIGVLDGFHAIAAPVNNFILLHSLSMFFGGIFFSFMWLSGIVRFNRVIKRVHWFVMTAFILISIWIISSPKTMPRMLNKGEFTPITIFLNMFGGVFFLVGTAFFLRYFYRTLEKEFYWLANFSLLLALSGFTFTYGDIWTNQWWFWHVLRLAAFIIALSIVINNYHKNISDLQITLKERKLTENRLRESEAFTRAVMENVPIGIAVNSVDPDVTFEYMNDNFPKFYRTKRENLATPDAFWESVYENPDFREKIKKQVFDDISSGDPECMYWKDVPITRKGEETTFITARNVPIPDKKLMISTVWDVTERKQVEETIRDREELLNKVGDIAQIGGWEMDLEKGGKATWTKGTYNIVEINPEEPIPGADEHVSWYLPEYHEMIEKKMKDLIETKQPMMFEAMLKTKKGNLKWCQTIGEVVERNGEVVKLRGIFHDITERKQVEEELRKYQQHLEKLVEERTSALEAKNQELETFTYSVSHDLKAPLRGIDGYSRWLIEDYANKLDEEGVLFLQNIRQSAAQMNQLIEDLLSYSRMERKAIQLVTVDLISIIDALILEREHDIETRQVNLSINLPFTKVISDIETIRQVLGNYLDNAIKYLKRNTPGTIEIDGEENGDSLTVWVKDNGIGFDPQYHDRIFEIFQRLHRIDEFPGTGVGLAIVRKAVERIGGRVWAESEPDEGSTFFVTIPKNASIK